MVQIPKETISLMAAMAEEGASSEEIADWLSIEHGIHLSARGVRNKLTAAQRNRGTVQEALGRGLAADLERLESLADDLSSMIRLAREGMQDSSKANREVEFCMKSFTKLADLLIKCTDRKLHYAGAAPSDADDPSTLSEDELEERMVKGLEETIAARPELRDRLKGVLQ